MSQLLVALTLIAVVLVIAALGSGLVERTPISFPMIFLGLGFLLGPGGLGIIVIGPHNPALEAVAILSLAFVLFLDAISLRLNEVGREWVVPVLTLGPGTLLTLVLIAVAARFLLGLSLVEALMVAAALSSIDPVVLRSVVDNEQIPISVRRALRIEAGANDSVVLPIVLALITVTTAGIASPVGWIVRLGQLFLVGPLVGLVVGVASVWLIKKARSLVEISRQYRALYGVGTVLAAYAAGEWAGGSGFLAVFTGGAVVAWLDYDLCDCFVEYSEITSELTMLLVFLLFGVLLSATMGAAISLAAVGFALLVIVVARPMAISVVLVRATISPRARIFIGWFGPRGLSSLLFALLIVQAGVPNALHLLGIVGLVVTISVVAHGLTAAPLATWYGRAVAGETLAEEREGTPAGLFRPAPTAVPRITVQQLAELLAQPKPPIVLDVRSRSTYRREPGQIPGSIRVLPDRVMEWADDRPRDRLVVAYCT